MNAFLQFAFKNSSAASSKSSFYLAIKNAIALQSAIFFSFFCFIVFDIQAHCAYKLTLFI